MGICFSKHSVTLTKSVVSPLNAHSVKSNSENLIRKVNLLKKQSGIYIPVKNLLTVLFQEVSLPFRKRKQKQTQ